jgi:hypothetical protein
MDKKLCNLSYSSTGHEDKKSHKDDQSSLVPVAWTVLVMGLSLAAITIVYLWIGHIGPTNSAQTLERQQRALRKQYGLAPEPVITNPNILQIPPSLRNVSNSTYYSPI